MEHGPNSRVLTDVPVFLRKELRQIKLDSRMTKDLLNRYGFKI